MELSIFELKLQCEMFTFQINIGDILGGIKYPGGGIKYPGGGMKYPGWDKISWVG